MNEKLKIMIAAGGTGGHVFPGVAIAESISENDKNASVIFVGTENGPESELVPKAGWPFRAMGSTSTHGGGFKNQLRTLAKLPGAFYRAVKVIRSEKPNMIIGTGGFATAPLIVAASFMGIPSAVVEPNAIAGRSNRLLSHFAKRVYIGFENAAKYFPRKKVYVSGIPIRKEIYKGEIKKYDGSGVMTVMCYGGSQGARRLNELMMDAIPHLNACAGRIKFIHQVGKATPVEVVAHTYKLGNFESEVFVFSDQMASLYQEADIVIARAGAGTVAEISAVKLPSILIPLPNSIDDHQRANARETVKSGGALMMEEKELSGQKLASVLMNFMEHPQKLAEMRNALNKASHVRAADRIVEDCLRIVRHN